jgi:hypothetical protein
MGERAVDWVWMTAGWCCLAVVALIAAAYVVVGLALVVDRIHLRYRRRKFREHAVVRIERGRVTLTDAALEAKLAALGPYEASASGGRVEFCWKESVGLQPGFAPLEVSFTVSPDNLGPDEMAFELLQRFINGQRQHWADFERELLTAYRAYELDDEPEQKLSDQEVLAQVRSVTIHVDQEGLGAEGLHDMSADFDIPWDEEHGFALGFNSATGRFDQDIL